MDVNQIKRRLSALALSAAMLIGCCACGSQDSPDNNGDQTMETEARIYTADEADYLTERWIAAEIPFSSEKYYPAEDCLYNVNLNVTFTSPSGAEYVMPGFWNGRQDWAVRFAPTECGMWSYRTSSAEPSLDGIEGTLACNAYTGELEIYRHGFVQAEKGKKYMTYADGTPFFYLGDTHWNMYAEEYNTAGTNAGALKDVKSHFKKIVDVRAEQGFTVYQSEPIDSPFDLTDGFDSFDIEGFKKADLYYQYIAEKGLVHANAEFFFSSAMSYAVFKTAENINNPEVYRYLEGISRYWVARFGAYPVIWTLAQECDDDFYYDRGDQRVFTAENNPWCKVCEYINRYDPYHHPLSAHQENVYYTTVTGVGTSSKSAFLETPGHDWWASQWSPNISGPQNFSIPFNYWKNEKAAVNYEGRYCGLWTKNFGARAQGWISFLSGMYGYGYGAADIWLYKSTYDLTTDSNDGVETITKEEKASYKWGDTLFFESAIQMGYLKAFLEENKWYTLEPFFEDYDLFRPAVDSKSWYAGAHDGNDRYVIYFYNTSYDPAGKLLKLDSAKTYTSRWFNPRTGEYTEIASGITPEEGKYQIPDKPQDNGDWVFVISSES